MAHEKHPVSSNTGVSQENEHIDIIMSDISTITSPHDLEKAHESLRAAQEGPAALHSPSFAQSECETIIGRQRVANQHGLKIVKIPSRYSHLDNQWEFAGWGTTSYLQLSDEDLATAETRISQKPPTVGQLRGTSLPGNSMTSSVFYAFPAVVAAASIFSPISLAVACLILFLWKPIFLELGSAIRLNGANYAYLLQVSGTTLGLVGAAATLLDSIATSTVSAATAASYLRGEFTSSPVSDSVVTIVVLSGLALICLANVRRSSTLTLSFFLVHVLTMAALMIASVISWARNGSDILVSNWELRPRGTDTVTKAIFYGICIGFLGVTGFETTPTYIQAIRPNAYSGVLRNILISTLILNAPLILLVYAILPSQTILGGANILSILAENVAGRWLRIIVVVDAILVLAGGVIDGICSACALLERLALDGVFSAKLLKKLPVTDAPYISIACCFALNILLYASSAFNLATISSVFTVAFLFVLLLFVLSNLLLKFNRDRLPRSPQSGIFSVFLTFVLVLILLIGNIVQEPKILGLFAIYFLAILLPLLAMRERDPAGRILMWLYDRVELHSCRWTAGWDTKMVSAIKQARKHTICVWVRREDLHNLLDIMLYIRNNETTAHVLFIHAYQDMKSIPAQLTPNVKILDEAFPATTIDLVFVRGVFGPTLVEAVSKKRDIPRSQMFMSCPGKDHGWELAEYQGVRVVNF